MGSSSAQNFLKNSEVKPSGTGDSTELKKNRVVFTSSLMASGKAKHSLPLKSPLEIQLGLGDGEGQISWTDYKKKSLKGVPFPFPLYLICSLLLCLVQKSLKFCGWPLAHMLCHESIAFMSWASLMCTSFLLKCLQTSSATLAILPNSLALELKKEWGIKLATRNFLLLEKNKLLSQWSMNYKLLRRQEGEKKTPGVAFSHLNPTTYSISVGSRQITC